MSTALLDEHLRMLKLPGALASYKRLSEGATDPVDYLAEVVKAEMNRRQENRVTGRIAAAHFPTLKSFENFDFIAQQGISKVKLLELTDGQFIRERRNLIFYGPPGVGKTHCLLAIGLAACMKGHRTLFTTAASLLTMLLDAKREGSITRRLKYLERFSLLLIDELGYIPFEREATDILFQVISARYERASIAITTNLAFEQWTQVFPDAMAASAVIDRLIHHGSVFEFTGTSHRLTNRIATTPTRAKPNASTA
jgi:DNA replication protein DnaC